MRALSALLLAGCAGGEPAPPAAALAPGGWLEELVREPAKFAALVADPDQRLAWAALHRGDYGSATAAGGAAALAARDRQATYEADLARLAELAWPLTFQAWEDRAGLPAASAIPVLVAASLLDSGDGDAARLWLGRLGPAANDDSQQSARALADHAALAQPPALGAGPGLGAGGGPLGRCLNAHQDARLAHQDLPASACGQPLLEEASPGGPRRLYDPLIHGTRARALGAAGLVEDGLAGRIFTHGWSCGPSRSEPDCRAHRSSLGLPTQAPDPSAPDDADQARDVLQAFDQALGLLALTLSQSADAEGRELLDNLRLIDLFRSRTLVALARDALAARHPDEALVFAMAARDMGAPRAIGPASPPELFALTAEAQLRAGHSREALDALQVLVQADPRVLGLSETIGDLAVLETLNRRGDSKER